MDMKATGIVRRVGFALTIAFTPAIVYTDSGFLYS